MPTRVLVTGSRSWYSLDLALSVLNRLLARYGPDLTIVHGDCKTGIDASFAEACRELGVEQEPHPADWSLGRGAGPIRNSEMVAAGAVLCLVFSHDLSRSRGTSDCARKAIATGIPTWHIADETGLPRRLERV